MTGGITKLISSPNSRPDILPDFQVSLDVRVRWGEMDSYQHVNNTVYLRYFEDARILYFERAGVMTTPPIGPILAETSCRFRAPLVYPDMCTVGARVTDISSSGFHMEYAIYSHTLQTIAAKGDGRFVSYNYETKAKAPLPQSWREHMEQIENSS